LSASGCADNLGRVVGSVAENSVRRGSPRDVFGLPISGAVEFLAAGIVAVTPRHRPIPRNAMFNQ